MIRLRMHFQASAGHPLSVTPACGTRIYEGMVAKAPGADLSKVDCKRCRLYLSRHPHIVSYPDCAWRAYRLGTMPLERQEEYRRLWALADAWQAVPYGHHVKQIADDDATGVQRE